MPVFLALNGIDLKYTQKERLSDDDRSFLYV